MSWIHHLEKAWLSLAYKNRGPLKLAAPLLIPASILYSGINSIRRYLYRAGLIASHRVHIPVISIGNLTIGGTGKTPFCLFLAKMLLDHGYKPAILLRGYRRKDNQPLLLTKQKFNSIKTEDFGDEAILLHLHSSVPVAVGSNRALSAQTILSETNCDILLLDDGFQHLCLQRDLNLMVISQEQGLGNGYVLPYGPLREPASAFAAADALLVNELSSSAIPSEIGKKQSFSPWERDHMPVFKGNLTWIAIQPLEQWLTRSEKHLHPITDFTGKAINLVSGIGSPERLENQAKEYGFRINWHFSFPDHYWFTLDDLKHIKTISPNVPVLMTEKDAVRLFPLLGQLDFYYPLTYVIRAEWTMQEPHNLIQWIKTKLANGRSSPS